MPDIQHEYLPEFFSPQALEERSAHFVLQLADLLGQRRLRDALVLGRLGETIAAGDRAEVPQVVNVNSLM
jgi:hypothetical protein